MFLLCGGTLETNCIRKPERQLPGSSYNHNKPTTLTMPVKESLQTYFKVAVRNFQESPACIRSMHGSYNSLLQLWSTFVVTPSQAFWGFSVYCCCNWAGASQVATCMQLVTHTKVINSYNHCLYTACDATKVTTLWLNHQLVLRSTLFQSRSQAFPGSSFWSLATFLQTVSDQKLKLGKAWERG